MTKTEYYNEKSDAYKVSGGRLDAILSLLPSDSAEILDVGCGEGHLARELVKYGHRVAGADISQEALEKAAPAIVSGFCFDVEDKQWPQELTGKKFDVIVASEIIEHVFVPDQLLQKLKNLLAPGGRIIITTPNVLFWKNRLKMLAGSFEYQKTGIMDFGHIRFFTIETARKAFRDAGLQIENENHFYPNLYRRGLHWLGNLFPGLFAYHMVFRLKEVHE